jgi:hypothetical protein
MIRERALKIVLGLVGLIFVLTVYPLMMNLWPTWHPNHEFEQMMLSVYATLGIFLLLALRKPSANRSLIAFTAWSSFAHAAVMTVQAFHLVSDRGHLLGGSLALVIVGVALLVLAPKQPAERASAPGA